MTEQLPPLPVPKHVRVWFEVTRTVCAIIGATCAVLAALRIYGLI